MTQLHSKYGLKAPQQGKKNMSSRNPHHCNQSLVYHVLHRGRHRMRLYRIKGRPREPEQTVISAILQEGGAQMTRDFNGLIGDCDTRDGHVVGEDVARG